MTNKQVLALAYDAGVEEEYNRLDSSSEFRAEYQLMISMIARYIRPGSVVYDIGSGPGRYSEYLLERDCKVGAVDLSAGTLSALQKRIGLSKQTNLLFVRQACATAYMDLRPSSADAILLMGPLYHLTEREERELAVRQACELLKPGGVIFCVFMNTCQKDIGFQEPENSVVDEQITTVRFSGYDVEQYRCCPAIAEELMIQSGFSTLHLGHMDYICSQSHVVTVDEMVESLIRDINSSFISCKASQFLYIGQKNMNNEN
jgi:SAM-dependent methyltransferase